MPVVSIDIARYPSRHEGSIEVIVDIEERYNPFTGKRIVPGLEDSVPTAAAMGLEPPRFCEQCGRRMIVQVSPDGWWAKCSRHGVLDSTSLEHR